MSAQQNTTIVSRFYEELWNDRNLSVADEIFAPDCMTHQLRSGTEAIGVPRGPEAIKHHVAEWLIAFPDLHFTIEQMIDGEYQVMTQSVMHGTHTGAWFGISPTGKQVSIRMMTMHQILDGKINKDWVMVEMLGLLQQLELVPSTQKILAQAIK